MINSTNDAAAAAVAPNTPPTLSKLQGDSVTFLGAAIRLDAGADAAVVDADAVGFEMKRVATGLDRALYVAPVPDGSGRVFVVSKQGPIYILNPETGARSVFLDLTGQVRTTGEGGVASIVTAPDFAQTGTFYVYLANVVGDVEVRRYTTLAANRDLADPASGDVIMTIPHASSNIHYAGWMGFGADGLLYITTGDAATSANAQNKDSLLGKVLRIDVSSDAFPDDPLRDYAIPSSNPFAAGGGAGEVRALGLRNPYRASFDPVTGNLYVADVGESRIEEVNLIRPDDVAPNFGWANYEGTFPYNGGPQGTPPVAQYFHPGDGKSIIGGYVYRGPIEALQGQYFFADFVSRRFYSLAAADMAIGTTLRPEQFGQRTNSFLPDQGSYNLIASWGTDEAGNLYIAELDGEIFRLQAATVRNFAGGSLTVDITQNKVAGEDRLQFDLGPAAGVTLSNGTASGSIVSVGGVRVGTIGFLGSGIGTDKLIVEFSGGATEARVGALIQALTYTNTNQVDRSVAPRTITYTLKDGGGTAGGGQDTLVVTSIVNLVPAGDDLAETTDAGTVLIDVLANDGASSTEDVVEVNGQKIAAGQTVTLASGAKVTLTGDNELRYDPNGRFDALNDGSGGAVNTSAMDSFTYGRSGGAGATVRVIINGTAGAGDRLLGNGSDNTVTGTTSRDFFDLSQGGDDEAIGLAGDDSFYFGAAMTSDDKVDGGEGVDTLALQGDYRAAPLVLGAGVVGLELIALLPGSDTRYGAPGDETLGYDITTSDENVSRGIQLRIDGARLRAGENLTFDGSAETDGRIRIAGGRGIDDLTTGKGSDSFHFTTATWGADDRIDGGEGIDQLGLQGNFDIVFGAGQLTGIELVALISGRDLGSGDFTYRIATVDENVGAGLRLGIDGALLKGTETMIFDGSAEKDGFFRIAGGAGADTLKGGDLADVIEGRGGADQLTGNGGNDRFVYREASHSDPAAQDHIVDFARGDLIDLGGMDARTTGEANDSFTFIGSSAFSKQAGQLRAAETQTPGVWTVQGDRDGDGSSDFQLMVTVVDQHPLTAADFVL